jgi:spore coat protein A
MPGANLSTTVWGYNTSQSFGYLGPTIVAKENNAVDIQWVNLLGAGMYPLPLDVTLHWAFSHLGGPTLADGIPAVPHLHGGHTESASDGLPEAWWIGENNMPTHYGDFFVKTNYHYDNDQEAATLWYHDHTLGITRLNVYMGMAAFYLLRDNNEEALIAANSLPSGSQEIEIVLQDKMFYPDGSLAYPDVTALPVPGFDPFPGGPSVQPEFFGEVIVVNGKAWPVLDVEPRKYRFRFLNGSDSRFYSMRMVAPVQTNQKLWWNIIGSDDGFLNAPQSERELLIAPGERYDVVVDFSDPALLGQTIIVKNNARSPFPFGAPNNPNTTSQIMAFRVSNTPVVDPVVLPATLRAPIVQLTTTLNPRKLLLFEGLDNFGRLQPMLGVAAPTVGKDGATVDGTLLWTDAITELPVNNSVEIWEVYNTTADAHPIHLHLVTYQILGRQKFTGTITPKTNIAHDGSSSIGGTLSTISLKGKRKGPAMYEAGWKDTGIMYPGEVTTVVAKFDRIGRYVWHCHILSHEDHEMMRPFEVVTGLPKQNGGVIAGVTDYSLEQNYPNPFNPSTTINFSVPNENTLVSLKIYNSLGQEVGTLINQVVPAGNHEVQFDATGLSSGVYFYTLTAGSFVESKKMALMK